MASNSFKVKNNLHLTPQATAPSGLEIGDIWSDANGKIYRFDGSASREIGSAQGGINYIENSDFESNSTGYVAYKDADQAIVVDGTGGTPTGLSIARSTSSPLRGTASGLISKTSGASRRGEGISDDFTINTADQAKMLEISFDYTVTANYVDGDVRMYIYDVTNAQVIEPSQRDLLANSGQATYRGYFQANSNSVSYRLIFHVATSTTLAYDFKLDNVKVGPIVAGNAGTFISDWQAYTPTFTGLGTVTGIEIFQRRVGSNLEVYGKFVTGTVTAAAVTMTLPGGLTIASPLTGNQGCGYYYRNASGGSHGGAMLANAGNAFVAFSSPAVFGSPIVNPMSTGVGNVDFPSSEIMNFRFEVPIQGWSTGVSASEIPSGNTIALRAYNLGGHTISTTTATTVQYNTVETDTAGGFNTGTYTYTIPETGIYFLSASYLLGSYITEEKNTIRILRNGSSIIIEEGSTTGTAWVNNATGIKLCNKGDTITVSSASQTDTSYTIDASQAATSLSIFKINNPAQIAPTEVIACSYDTNAGQSIPNITLTTVVFEDRLHDTHNAYNTSNGIYTVPVSGIYRVSATLTTSSTAAFSGTGEVFYPTIHKNSVMYSVGHYYIPSSNNDEKNTVVYGEVDCKAGDTLEIKLSQSTGAALTLLGVSKYNTMSISRIK